MQQPQTLERTSTNDKELEIAGKFNLSEDEVAGGMDEGGLGYLDQYPYRVRLSGSDFEVIDSKTNQQVWTGKELPGILFYGHSVYRLLQGTVNGMDGDPKKWPEDMREIAAMSFGSPFGDSQSSRGNFDANGHSQYLDNKELRKQVKKRLYLFMKLPQAINGGQLAAATFGGTALIPFGAYHSSMKGKNAPLPLVKSVLYTEKTTNDNNEEYYELRIKPLLNKEGKIAASVQNDDEYRKNIKPILEKIIETHKFAMKRLEGQSGAERTVPSAGAHREIGAPVSNGKAANFSPSPGEKDEIPSGSFSDDDLEF